MGVTLFILLTGDMPFFAEFEADLFRKIRVGKYIFPSSIDQQREESTVDLISEQVKHLIK